MTSIAPPAGTTTRSPTATPTGHASKGETEKVDHDAEVSSSYAKATIVVVGVTFAIFAGIVIAFCCLRRRRANSDARFRPVDDEPNTAVSMVESSAHVLAGRQHEAGESLSLEMVGQARAAGRPIDADESMFVVDDEEDDMLGLGAELDDYR
uniref:Transmembrane protein n=1 Tax=Lotharella globosa TaxID=91324 RepID=A0A6V3K3S2_9EUKA